jgi:hypothetical protein
MIASLGRRRASRALTLALLLGAPHVARAEGLVPGPADPGFDAALAAKAEAYDRQIHAFLTPPLGWGLEAFVADAAHRTLIAEFIASGQHDFQAFSGLHPYQVIDRYEEFGDLGMFGGVQAAGDAFRYAVLRDGGAPAEDVERARAAVLRAMDGLHAYTRITGVPGVIARGLMRITAEPGEPPLPDEIPETTPLFDAAGQPLPAEKTATWREDASGELGHLIWLDDTSKDQFDGYVFALGAVHDVIADDSSIDLDRKLRLIADAKAIGERLMEPVEVAPGSIIDLVLMDADGRPTRFHDLSAEEITAGLVLDAPANGFNGWMALGAMRTLFHITGEERIGLFYARLVAERQYLTVARDSIRAMYTGSDTNFSNVNMAFVAAYNVLRYENDPAIAAEARAILEERLYAGGVDRDADDLGMSFFDFVYAAFRDAGSADEAGADARADGLATLAAAPEAPYWDPLVEHCDATELAALSCQATDGTPIALSREPGWGGGIVAAAPLPPALRPPTNFEWRSDPHSVNGGGSDRLNPGGGFHGAYWMGRFLLSGSDGFANVSPTARTLPELPEGSGGAGGGSATEPGAAASEGCGCRQVGSATTGFGWLASALLLGALARRRPTRAPWRSEL